MINVFYLHISLITRTAEDETKLKSLTNQMSSFMGSSNEITSLPNESHPNTYQIQENVSRTLLTNENEEPLLTAEMSNEMFSLDRQDVREANENESLLFNNNKQSLEGISLCDNDSLQIHTATKPGHKIWGQNREDVPLNLDERPCLPGRSAVGNYNQDFLLSPESVNDASGLNSENQINEKQDDLESELTGTLYDEYVDDNS